MFSGLAGTGIVNFADVGFVILKLGIFTIAVLVLGALVIPRIVNFTQRFRSNEALLITSLGLCFAMALFDNSGDEDSYDSEVMTLQFKK